jgi:hypothetical protein
MNITSATSVSYLNSYNPAEYLAKQPLPEKKTKPVAKMLVTVGFLGSVVLGLTWLFPRSILGKLAQTLKRLEKREAFSFLPNADRVLRFSQDRKAVEKKLVRMIALTNLAQSPLIFQTAINAKQPSMLLHQTLNASYQLGALFTSNVVFRTTYLLIAGLFSYSGKQNDIGNTRHMKDRKEWELSRLSALFSPGRFRFQQAHLKAIKNELNSCARYILSDLKAAFSVKPWQDFFKTYREKSTWLEPNPIFTAFASQFNLAANLINLMALKCPKPLEGILPKLPFPLMLLRNLSSAKTELVRAWQNRTDLDGILVLIGQPLTTIGTAFFISKKYFHLNGLALIAMPITELGLNLSTRYRREAINYVTEIYQLASQNPSLEADELLAYYRMHPDMLKKLKRKTGTLGLKFILNALQDAEYKRRIYGIPLAQALRPVVLPNAQ